MASKVSPTAGAVRLPGLRQCVDTTIGGYSPSFTKPTLATPTTFAKCSAPRIACFECPYAASSIARIAVSGWLIGSTPTRLTIDVTVPSASASTHAARCSRPRCGSPGNSTHPDATPAHSGSEGTVSDGGCSIISAGGVWSAKCPGATADSPTTGPSASTSPTVPGSGSSGKSSRTPKIVVVESNPGSDATRTATMSSCAHSLVESGQRPETTKPFSEPCEWNGATSMARPDPVLISVASLTLRFRQHAVCGGGLQGDTTVAGLSEDQALGLRGGRGEAILDVGPIHHVPERFDVVGLHVLVLQIERVLPHVDLQQRDDAQRHVGLLVVELERQQLVAEAVVPQHRPARPLQAVGGGGELRLERVERAECVVERRGEIARRLVATLRRQVLPPDRVVHVTPEMERKVLLVQED